MGKSSARLMEARPAAPAPCSFYSHLVKNPRSLPFPAMTLRSSGSGSNADQRQAREPQWLPNLRHDVCVQLRTRFHCATPVHSESSSRRIWFTENNGGGHMSVRLFDAKGTPLEKQAFTWKELVQNPISKLDDDAFTRVRVILMNGIEQ